MINEIVVSVCCLAYNHEAFIKDAIEGFLIQETDFPIEILIHDDASTDGTSEIIKYYQDTYPGKFIVVFQNVNQFSQGKNVLEPLFKIARGKYIAICEGDDYWTDPYKLQKQVDFMEQHLDCSICCHKVSFKFENDDNKTLLFPDIVGDKVFDKSELNKRFFIKTCSLLIQNIHMKELLSFLEGFKVKDTPMWYFFAEHGHIAYLDDIMAVYRVHGTSYWSSLDDYQQLLISLDTYENILKRLKLPGISKRLLNINLELARYYEKINDRKGMERHSIKTWRFLKYASSEQFREMADLSIKAFAIKPAQNVQEK